MLIALTVLGGAITVFGLSFGATMAALRVFHGPVVCDEEEEAAADDAKA